MKGLVSRWLVVLADHAQPGCQQLCVSGRPKPSLDAVGDPEAASVMNVSGSLVCFPRDFGKCRKILSVERIFSVAGCTLILFGVEWARPGARLTRCLSPKAEASSLRAHENSDVFQVLCRPHQGEVDRNLLRFPRHLKLAAMR
ncbi:unnamed protein product [Scytosiphon promiscuus]